MGLYGDHVVSTKDETGLTVEQLSRELQAFDPSAESRDTSAGSRSAELIDDIVDGLFPNQSFSFDDEMVKNSLDELLLVLVALRSEQTHGKGLMDDLANVFDSRLSPGTVYPRLHELEEQDLLDVHELVRTKEYRIDGRDESRVTIQSAMTQHIALGYVLFSALEEL